MTLANVSLVIGLILAIGSPIVTVAISASNMKTKINYLEKKMDKHNGFMQRLAIAETKIDNLEKEG